MNEMPNALNNCFVDRNTGERFVFGYIQDAF